MSEKKLVIMRGPGGAGKSYAVRKMLMTKDFDSAPMYEGTASPIVCSADDFFMSRETKEFEFDPTKLSEAHQWCFNRFLKMLTNNARFIIVDNTNMRWWEFKNYVWAAAMRGGYEIEIYTILPVAMKGFAICVQRQRHGVPVGVLALQILGFEPYPLWKDEVPSNQKLEFTQRDIWAPIDDE